MVKAAVAANFLCWLLLSTSLSSLSSVTCLRFPFAPLAVLRNSRRVFWYIASFSDDIVNNNSKQSLTSVGRFKPVRLWKSARSRSRPSIRFSTFMFFD